LLMPHYECKDTIYRKAVPVRVRVACALNQLVHGASLLMCYEQFAIGKSTVSCIGRDIVHGVNVEFRSEIQFSCGNRLQNVMMDFQQFCGLPAMAGAIDGMHIHIWKPFVGPEDYFYFKTFG
jgi:hypothetical protein